MATQINEILEILEKINLQIQKQLLSSKQLSNGSEHLHNLKKYRTALIEKIQQTEKSQPSSQESIKKAINTVNDSLKNIIQELKNIDSLITISARNYVKYLEKTGNKWWRQQNL